MKQLPTSTKDSPSEKQAVRAIEYVLQYRARVRFSPIDQPDNIQRETIQTSLNEQGIRQMYASCDCAVLDVEVTD